MSTDRRHRTVGDVDDRQRYRLRSTGEDWRVVLGPTPADLGELGLGAPEDDVFRTPVGTFPLGQAFGRQPNPGTRMPYFQATNEDWWDEEVDSPTYNTHVHAATIDSEDAENLYGSGGIYDYVVRRDDFRWVGSSLRVGVGRRWRRGA